MPDDGDRTIGELARQIEAMRRDQAQQARAIQDQLRSLVSLEYLNLLEGRLSDRMNNIAEDVNDRKNEINSLRSNIRYIIGIVIAGAAIIIPLLLQAQGSA